MGNASSKSVKSIKSLIIPDEDDAISFKCPVFECEGSVCVLLPNSGYLSAESCASINSKSESLFSLSFFSASSRNNFFLIIKTVLVLTFYI